MFNQRNDSVIHFQHVNSDLNLNPTTNKSDINLATDALMNPSPDVSRLGAAYSPRNPSPYDESRKTGSSVIEATFDEAKNMNLGNYDDL